MDEKALAWSLFAAAALKALILSDEDREGIQIVAAHRESSRHAVSAEEAARYADAMLEEFRKREG